MDYNLLNFFNAFLFGSQSFTKQNYTFPTAGLSTKVRPVEPGIWAYPVPVSRAGPGPYSQTREVNSLCSNARMTNAS